MAGSRKDVRLRLQRAALELYAERGFDRATAADIAARAGVTERTYFRHFPDKREVLFDGEGVMQTALITAVASAPADLPPLPALMDAFLAAVPIFERDREAKQFRHRIISATPELQERELMKMAHLTAALADALEQRAVPPGRPRWPRPAVRPCSRAPGCSGSPGLRVATPFSWPTLSPNWGCWSPPASSPRSGQCPASVSPGILRPPPRVPMSSRPSGRLPADRPVRKEPPMISLRDVLQPHVSDGPVPGVVAIVARGERVEVQVAGHADAEGRTELARDSIFRIASISKPVTAAAVLMLADDGVLALEDPVERWLPELAAPVVVATPASPVDDVVPVARPITVADLLTFRAGYGFPSDFSLPAVPLLFSELMQGPPQPQAVAAPDDWMKRLARIPMLHQPGEAWLYNTCSDIQGVLIARAAGQPLPEFLAERLFEPLGMTDTGFAVPRPSSAGCSRTTRRRPTAAWRWSTSPRPVEQPAGVPLRGRRPGVHRRRLARLRPHAAGRGTAGGRQLLSPPSVRQMTTDHLTSSQRDASRLFLEGQGWGFGGSVDVVAADPVECPRPVWLGRRHRDRGPHCPGHRPDVDPVQPGGR